MQTEKSTGGAFAHCTLRDWFAGQAVVGLSSDIELDAESIRHCAQAAYALADALVAEGAKE